MNKGYWRYLEVIMQILFLFAFIGLVVGIIVFVLFVKWLWRQV